MYLGMMLKLVLSLFSFISTMPPHRAPRNPDEVLVRDENPHAEHPEVSTIVAQGALVAQPNLEAGALL